MADSIPHSGKRKAYAAETEHKTLEGDTFKAVKGTQSLDGWWKHSKRAVGAVNARYPKPVWQRVLAEQWQHWMGNEDRWKAAGEVLDWASKQ